MSWIFGKYYKFILLKMPRTLPKMDYCSIKISFFSLASISFFSLVSHTFLLYFKMFKLVGKKASSFESPFCH